MAGFNPVTDAKIVVSKALVKEKGVPFIYVPTKPAGSVPQINECRVLLPNALTRDLN